MSEDMVYTLSIWQINYLKNLFATTIIFNVGICNGKMIVGYMKDGIYDRESIPRVPNIEQGAQGSDTTEVPHRP